MHYPDPTDVLLLVILRCTREVEGYLVSKALAKRTLAFSILRQPSYDVR
jgi:hypothetical protein